MRGAAGTFVSPSLPASVMRSSRAQGVQDARGSQSTEGAATPRTPTESRDGQAAARQLAVTVTMSGEPRPLQPGLPALDAFPTKVWNRLVAQRARSGARAMLAYPDPAGYRPLREHIATYLGLSRGVTCLPEQVFVTGGYRATLELVLRSLARPNDRVWFEDPGYLLARGFLAETGVQLVPVPVDSEGIDVERGTLLDAQARFAMVTPSHQSPLGHTLSLARRMAQAVSRERCVRVWTADARDMSPDRELAQRFTPSHDATRALSERIPSACSMRSAQPDPPSPSHCGPPARRARRTLHLR
jgi:GntR family transcriptional regulator / MocR family aminotransferase